MKVIHLGIIACLTGLISASQVLAVDPEAIVDAQNTVFGKHKARSSGAKGQCVVGTFTPSFDAGQLTKAVIFVKPVPVVARFSMGGGNPKVPDTNKAVVRGFSFRLDPDGPQPTTFLMVNAPVNFASTLDQMLGFFQARYPGPDGKPDPDKIKAFTQANPNTARQAAYITSRPLVASYAGVNYWATQVYTLMNASGVSRKVKFKAVPQAGELTLTDDEAKLKAPDFLTSELSDRLSKAPVAFDLVAILGEESDPSSDSTSLWVDENKRKTVILGTISVTALTKNETCDEGIFDPTILADGIAGPVDDPMFIPRQAAYAISLSRRQ